MEDKLVTLLKVTSPHLGGFLKDKLEFDGIDCFFTNEGLDLGSEYQSDDVFLNVKSNQSEKAVKTLLQIQKDFDLDKIQEDSSYSDLKKILVPVKLSENCIELCK